MPQQTLEAELTQIFASSPSKRNREILVGYYGWQDGQSHTLTEVGDRFGITRERVRQICFKLLKKHPPAAATSTPAFDQALALIDKRLPAPAHELEAELAQKGLTAIGMSLEVLAEAANLLGRSAGFKIVKIEQAKSPPPKKIKSKAPPNPPPQKRGKKPAAPGRIAVRPDQVEAVQAIADLAKKEVYFHGLATVARLERIVARRHSSDQPLLRQVLSQIDAFRWLDEPAGWFTIQGIAKHGLPKAVEKVLAVAGEVSVAAMRTALSRNRRLWKEPPPEKVLLEYCRLMPNVRIEGDRVRSDPPRNWKKILSGIEAKLIAVLKKHGPLLDRGAMEDICVAAGMNRFSFHAFVSWSPVVEQFGHSLYGPIGASVTREQIDKLLAQRRTNRASERVLRDHGVDDEGRVWLKYKLSKAASTYAVITVPAAMKKIVRGRFQLRTPGGKNIGALVAKDGRAWGLGAFLRRCGAKSGDLVTLTLDLPTRTATVVWKKRP